jgi:hypothetical protein
MKHILLLLIAFAANAFGQEYVIGPDVVAQRSGTLSSTTVVRRGGREITTQGTLRVLRSLSIGMRQNIFWFSHHDRQV